MEPISLHYDVSGTDFTCAGEASGKIKATLKELGFPAALKPISFNAFFMLPEASPAQVKSDPLTSKCNLSGSIRFRCLL